MALPQKPRALRAGSRIASIAPASSANPEQIDVGKRELERLGFVVSLQPAMNPDGYFAGSASERRTQFLTALADPSTDGLVATRGGYGSVYLLEDGLPDALPGNKPLIGFSDLTTLQIYLWQKHRWVTFYGPMLAAGLCAGQGAPNGYDADSFQSALVNFDSSWELNLRGETLREGSVEGVLLGGAMTLIEATLGTPWELDTTNAILLLEDRAMKPYQVDRVLMHLKHAGKLKDVRGMVLGDFPECEAPIPGSPSVREVALRILSPLGIPIVYGVPVGHTARPMLTLPLGIRARLLAEGDGTLEILEPSVLP